MIRWDSKKILFSFSVDGVREIINGYAREAGVRTLENNIKKILRKVALQIVRTQENNAQKKRRSVAALQQKHKITPQNLQKYLGKPVFISERYYQNTPVGICVGLAWTSMGGVTLYIETIDFENEKTEMKLTGQAGDVMKESAEIAWSYFQSTYKQYTEVTSFFKEKTHSYPYP